MPYQTNKPAPSDNLDDSVTDIQVNFDIANTIMAIDHWPFDDISSSQGKHKPIHIPVPQNIGTSPGTDALEWAYYTKTLASGAVETFWKRPGITPNGADIQMSSNVYPQSSATNAVTFLPGGLVLVCGRTSIGAGTSYTITYPYSLTVTDTISVSISVQSVNLLTVNTFGATGFGGIKANTAVNLNWIAICKL